MLSTAPADDRHAASPSMDIPWPPTIKPPALSAIEFQAERQAPRSPARGLRGLRESSTLWFWLGVYIAVNLGDLISTAVGLRAGLREGNPLMRSLLSQFGFAALVAYKVVVIVGVVAGLSLLARRHPRLAAVTLTVCNILVGLAVVLNVVQFAMI